ncbi:hypothetical protein [Thermospira aquatica]|uniref:DUF5723 domain-containing protein n=1 Tax=Thermospira aquatica TaxID=2828656 RepID=A0AAX3BCA3_9SPIR|nr:hypothetical protein [Thermospira aquatica]URA09814.1 hypothetical protein KDW03_10050 [Thermospira aquatica]
MKRFLVYVGMGLPLLVFGTTDISLDVEAMLATGVTNGNIYLMPLKNRLGLHNKLGENIHAVAGINFLYNPLEEKSTMTNKESVFPFTWHIDEAYLKINHFLWEPIDLVAGKQRISWGKADKINPTDLWNPVVLQNPLDLAQKEASLALNLICYLPWGESTALNFIWEPVVSRSVLPSFLYEKRLDTMINQSVSNVSSFTIEAPWEVSLQLPAYHLSNSSFGGRFQTSLIGFDMSTSLVYRYNDVPYIQEIFLSSTVTGFPLQTNLTMESRSYKMGYYREAIWGFDVAKDFGFVNSWFEATITWPETQQTIVYDSRTISIGITTVTTNSTNVLEKAYIKYVLGMEKNFSSGWYINLQYAKGLLAERGEDMEHPQDYLISRVEKTLLNDAWKIAITSIFNTEDFGKSLGEQNIWKSLADTSAWALQGEVSFSPIVGVTLSTGISLIDGKGNSTLSLFEDMDMVYFQFKTSF